MVNITQKIKKIYFLQTCDTCRRILKEVNIDGFERQEIKTTPITVKQLEEMYVFSKSYEVLFNKRVKLYKAMSLKNQILTEKNINNLF